MTGKGGPSPVEDCQTALVPIRLVRLWPNYKLRPWIYRLGPTCTEASRLV